MLQPLEQVENIAFGPDPVRSFGSVAFGRVLAKVPALAHRLFDGAGCWCHVCGTEMKQFAHSHRPDHLSCPFCGAIDRDRFHLLVLEQRTNFFDGTPKKLLHIAPEPVLEPKLRNTPGVDYLSGDLMRPTAMVKLDICDMQFDDDTFDYAFCSHVLEHVPDDSVAMAEFARVLKPGGAVLFAFPQSAQPTIEDPTLTDRRERIRRFGQIDHLRVYGPDVVGRFEAAGLEVETLRPRDLCTPAEMRRFGFDVPVDTVAYLCRPATA